MRSVSNQVVLNNSSATLFFDDESAIVSHSFRGFTHGASLRQILDGGVELLREKRASKWLSDDRGNGALPQADVQWCQTDWFPRAMAAGWKFWALVQPETVLGQMNMKRFTSMYAELGLTVKVFTEVEPAREWLLKQ